jgi:phospholipid/cholesterol/gamma-HCH transport system substrate-binding protein
VIELTQRRQNVLSGAIALLLLVSAITVGVKSAFGAFAGGYRISGEFSSAGQGLLQGSDVKVDGVNVGSVRGIELRDGKAHITMRIHDGERIPADAKAVIRAKTLFGEKFVDLDLHGTDEEHGPFLHEGSVLRHTEGGFELEQVLNELDPILDPSQGGIKGTELMTVLHNLAEGGRGLGDEINRTLVNGSKVAKTFEENDDKTSQFLEDFAALSDQLGRSADDLVGLAKAGNVALPVLNDHEAQIVTLLQQTGRLSNDVADLLLGNTAFVDASLGKGSKAVQVLYDRRNQVIPLVIGLRQYLQSLTEVIRIPVGDGTLMGAVKGILGNQVCALVPCGTNGSLSTSTKAGTPPSATTTVPPVAPTAPPATPSHSNPIDELLRRVLGA